MGNFPFGKASSLQDRYYNVREPVRDNTYCSPEACDYMEAYLCGEHEFHACIHYLKGEAQD